MKWQKCSAVFANDHIIIQALTCTWERWQYCRLMAHDTGPRNQGRSDSTWNDAKLLQMRGCGYQLVFSVCTRSASENNTFSNMPGCIASASQTTICPLLRGQSHTVPLHCIMGKLPRGGGWLHQPLGDDASMSAHVGRGTTTQDEVPSSLLSKIKKTSGGGALFSCRYERNKIDALGCTLCFASATNNKTKNKQATFVFVIKNIQLKGQGKVSLNMNLKWLVNETLESLQLCVCVLRTTVL